MTKITYPDSYYVEKVYDQLDRLTDIKLNGSSSSAAAFSYDDLSRRTNLTYLNGVDQDYGYDIGDNLTSMDLAWTGSSASWTYGYNDVEEMTSQAFSDTGFQWRPAATGTVSYGTANNLNQYPTVGGVTRTMNSDGCLTGDGTWTYTYDADNMLTQASKTGVTVDFVYDPFHRNIRKDDGTNKTRYIYAGDQILCEYNDTSGALINRYVYGFEADDPIIQVTAGGTVTYNTQDHVGSIIASTNSSGGILSKYKYAPFGESPSLSGTIFGFTGQRFDAETGLYHFKARYYDPVTGRFLQPDLVGYSASPNLYRYAKNSPLRYKDSSGNYEEDVGIQNTREYWPGVQEVGDAFVGARDQFTGHGLSDTEVASTSVGYQVGQAAAKVYTITTTAKLVANIAKGVGQLLSRPVGREFNYRPGNAPAPQSKVNADGAHSELGYGINWNKGGKVSIKARTYDKNGKFLGEHHMDAGGPGNPHPNPHFHPATSSGKFRSNAVPKSSSEHLNDW